MPWSFKSPSIPAKHQPWLKENQWWIQLVVLAVVAMIVVIAFKRGAWSDWVGFKGKTVWNWLELLGVPLALATLGYLLQQQQQQRAEMLSKEQREIAADEAKEEILQGYFDRLSTLLVDKNILAISTKVYALEKEQAETATPEERELLGAAIDVIRARTLSILRRFEGDGDRKASVLRFLIEAEVLSKAKLSLSRADLSGADLSGADLSRADLSRANLINANLINANFSDANLSGSNFSNANLFGAYLGGADLGGADLIDADLSGAYLSDANLGGAYLMGANLGFAHLMGANLSFADLRGTNLGGANIWRVIWHEQTLWPDPEAVAKAKNIPEKLKQQLGITSEAE